MGNYYEQLYLEWCDIMCLNPNIRDHIIFLAGMNFALIDVSKLVDKKGGE